MLPREDRKQLAAHRGEAPADPASWSVCSPSCEAGLVPGPRGRRTVGGGRKGGGKEESAKETLQLSPRDCLECNVPLHPLPFHIVIFFTERTQRRTYSRLRSSAANSDSPDMGTDKEKNTGILFFPSSPERSQRLKLRNPVMFEHRITCPLNGLDTICP